MEETLGSLSPSGSSFGLVDVFFNYDSQNITSESRSVLNQNASIINNSGGKFQVVVIEGYCDIRGTEEYNLALGQRRAESTKNYLVGLGVSPSKVQAVSKGETEQFAFGTSEYDYQQNRRAHFVPAF
ncbi:MAG: OmpA family protein [Deltaproteobacteria bacterium]|nr:OmpA family protein [Deltaproteobacteria bacterium]